MFQQLFKKTKLTYVWLEESVSMVDFFKELKDTINQTNKLWRLKQEDDVVEQIFNSLLKSCELLANNFDLFFKLLSLASWLRSYLLYNSAQSLPSQSLPIFFFEYINSAPLCGQGLGRVGVAGAWEYPRRATDRPGTLWGLGNFRIWFSGHGFQDLGSQL